MELTIVTKVNAAGARITIMFSPEKPDVHMRLEYTCPDCAGHGCNTHRQNNRECSGGTVYKTLDPAKLELTFTPEQIKPIQKVIQTLYNQICEHDGDR
jgi:predicted nucleic acid binding AN1-type Zn finger protein